MLLESICENVNGPVILDLGGGMPISLDGEYAKLQQRFLEINPTLFKMTFSHLDKIGEAQVKNVLGKFKNVCYLVLPTNLSNHGTRASNDVLNPMFVSSGQYETVSTTVKHINVEGMFTDEKKLKNILNQVTNSKRMQP